MEMTARIHAVVFFFLVAFPVSAQAIDLSGQSRTYLQTRELTDGTRLTPLYEYLDIRTDGSGADMVSFSAGGWYRYYLQSEGFDKKDTGDLQYAYLTLRKKTANASLNIGRVIVHEGAASSQLDGASARADLRGGFSVAAFGGVPLETDLDTRSGDAVYGGRIAHSVPGIYAVGASYLLEKNDSADFRKEEGFDVWVRPVSTFEVMGVSTYNAESKNWMQHQYYATLGPFAWLRLNLEASKTWYKEYFASTTMSAFSFANLDPNEIVTAAGGSAVIMAGGAFTIVADYRNYEYQVLNGSATYAGGSLAYAGSGIGAGAAAHRMNGPQDTLRYNEQRVYAFKKVSKADVTLDVLHIDYDQPINGENEAWTGSAALGYTATPKLRFVADGEYSKNPDFDRDVRAMLSMIYRFEFPLSTGPQPASAAKPDTKSRKRAR